MQKKKLIICQVSLLGNIKIVKENLLNFNKFYQNNFHYIICPKKEKIFFKKKVKDKNCKIINEEKIITFKKFKKIANKHLSKKLYFKKIQNRLNWYYQQILKLTFVINFTNKTKGSIIIWDADTIILKKILKKNIHKPFWKFNIEKNIEIIEEGGWHFNNLYTHETISKKLKTFQHSQFSSPKFSSPEIIKEKILKLEDLFGRNHKYKKVNFDNQYPEYILNNLNLFEKYIL